ncbi:MAG: hypothetical protein R6W78_17060, partial [Bacteroidales bacterium]
MKGLNFLFISFVVAFLCLQNNYAQEQETVELTPTHDAALIMCLKPGLGHMANTCYGADPRT